MGDNNKNMAVNRDTVADKSVMEMRQIIRDNTNKIVFIYTLFSLIFLFHAVSTHFFVFYAIPILAESSFFFFNLLCSFHCIFCAEKHLKNCQKIIVLSVS